MQGLSLGWGITNNGLSLVHKCLAKYCNSLRGCAFEDWLYSAEHSWHFSRIVLHSLSASEFYVEDKVVHLCQRIWHFSRIVLHSLSASEFYVEDKVVHLCQRMPGILRNERFVVEDGRYLFPGLNFNLVLFHL